MLGQRERMKENGIPSPQPREAKRSAAALPPDPEVVDKPGRRRFSPAYKLGILEEVDGCTEPGEIGRILRREGVYSSSLTTWRKAARNGSLKALSKKRGRKSERNPLDEKAPPAAAGAELLARVTDPTPEAPR
jgi:transposase